MFDNLRPLELIIILVVVLLLFGAKRLPDAARGLGRSMRILKAETKGLRDDDEPVETGYRDTTASRVEVRPLPPAAPATPAPGSERTFDDRTFGQASGSTTHEQPGTTER